MDIKLPENFYNILNKDFRKFKSFLLDEKYEVFKNHSTNDFQELFLYAIVDNAYAMKSVKNKLLKFNIHEKDINKCFYTILKFRYKLENGLFSWNEIEEWQIPYDQIKKTTTKFTFI
jgi:hypothetical protein